MILTLSSIYTTINIFVFHYVLASRDEIAKGLCKLLLFGVICVWAVLKKIFTCANFLYCFQEILNFYFSPKLVEVRLRNFFLQAFTLMNMLNTDPKDFVYKAVKLLLTLNLSQLIQCHLLRMFCTNNPTVENR